MGVHNMIQMNSTEVSFGEKKIWKFEKKFHDFFRFLKITKSAVWTWPPDIFQIFFSKKLISYLSETFGQKISEVFFRDQTMRFCATLCEISNFFLGLQSIFCRDYDPPKTAWDRAIKGIFRSETFP